MSDEGSVATYRALSLGAGVQSSVLALLLSRNDERLIDSGYSKPDVAVFADTGWEPDYVYEHLDWLETQLDFELIRVSDGNLKENLKRAKTVSGHDFVDVPMFVTKPDGKAGILRRQCTNHYKIRPIHREIRERAGGKRGRPFPKNTHAEMWLGISTDEIIRMKPSREPWTIHKWPLIDIGMSRQDCLDWFHSEYPDRHLPRSACVICPYRSDSHWQEMRDLEPESFDEAVRFDRWMRKTSRNPVRQVLSGRPYLHRTRRPLDSAVQGLADGTLVDDGLFEEDCEGHCGV